ncbi:hypothetical protein [Methylocystis heyeri]|uniref:Uncharacterized protein n=1 Tax=Methylocystis heyeri TaxID=391905 RepID=A0A6B8KFL4_9HYPH|nr:hypothetical protein [Methylocystis heyeri]QGM45791.1 hypothetical protein H2LOC_008790 [Methylocystis heyeri]
MSNRAKTIFEQFVAERLRRAEPLDPPSERLLADLMDKCLADDIPFAEIVEEVGDVEQAIAEALKAGRQEIR